MLGHEVGVLAQPVAGAFDLDDQSMMQQAVEECGGEDRVSEHLAPFGKAAVGGQDHRTTLVSGVDQLEEQVATPRDDGQVADLVDDQQSRSTEEAYAFRQFPFAFGAGELPEQVGECAEVDTAPCLHRLDAKGDGQVALAGAGRAKEVDDLAATDKAELREGEDAIAVDRRLEAEVEP